jgi:hypothetical protein
MVHAHVFFLIRVKHVTNTLTPIEKVIQKVAKKCARENFDVTWICAIRKTRDRFH